MVAWPQLIWRWAGGLALAGSLGMLVAGLTIWYARLSGLRFAAYWGGCLVLALGALAIALLDLLVVRRRIREEQLRLLRESFGGQSRGQTVTPPSPQPVDPV